MISKQPPCEVLKYENQKTKIIHKCVIKTCNTLQFTYLTIKKKISLTKLSKIVKIKQNKHNKSCYLYKYKKLTFPCLIPLHKVIDIVKFNLQNIENTYKHFLNL